MRHFIPLIMADTKAKEPIELTPEELKKQLEESNAKLAEQAAEKVASDKELEEARKIIKKQNEQLNAKPIADNKELEEARKIIAKQNKQLAKSEKAKDASKVIVEVDGKQGIVAIPKFSLDGITYEAKDLLLEENAAVVEKLVAKKSPIIQF